MQGRPQPHHRSTPDIERMRQEDGMWGMMGRGWVARYDGQTWAAGREVDTSCGGTAACTSQGSRAPRARGSTWGECTTWGHHMGAPHGGHCAALHPPHPFASPFTLGRSPLKLGPGPVILLDGGSEAALLVLPLLPDTHRLAMARYSTPCGVTVAPPYTDTAAAASHNPCSPVYPCPCMPSSSASPPCMPSCVPTLRRRLAAFAARFCITSRACMHQYGSANASFP